jgi:uncharacterized membrane protein
VQTLRNQVMAGHIFGLYIDSDLPGIVQRRFSPGCIQRSLAYAQSAGYKNRNLWMFKLMVLGIMFFFTFFNFTLCIRYYNHVGFMINTFQQNDSTVSAEAVTQVLNHGALHYTIGMRGFYLSVPLALWLFGPSWMLAGSLVLVAVLFRLDREA